MWKGGPGSWEVEEDRICGRGEGKCFVVGVGKEEAIFVDIPVGGDND